MIWLLLVQLQAELWFFNLFLHCLEGINRSSITALAWSPNGMKLFSGDNKGKIVYSALDLDMGSCNPSLVLEEPSAIVQLDYNQKVLLVSTLQRSLLFYTEEKSVKQIGIKSRKSNGKFGACFMPGLCKQSGLTVYAARPGLRLWRADAHGTVQTTFLLKDLMTEGIEAFELYPRLEPPNVGKFSPSEKNLGLVFCFFQEGWVLSWDEYNILLIDTVNQAVIGGLEGSGDIVSVSCTDDEIFLLKGDRDIIRISNRPEGLRSAGFDMNSKLHGPWVLNSSLSPASSMETDRQKGTPDVASHATLGICRKDSPLVANNELETLGNRDDSVGELSSEVRKGDSGTSETKSRSGSINSLDSGSSLPTGGDPSPPEVLREWQPFSQRFSLISSEEFNQELIVNPIKLKKRKHKRAEVRSRRQPGSLVSTPSSELQLSYDIPHSLTTDFFSDMASLQSSSTDLLSTDSPDIDSVLSGDSHSGLQEMMSSDAFSVLQSPESAAALLDDESITLCDTGSDSVQNVSSQSGLVAFASAERLIPELPLTLRGDSNVEFKSDLDSEKMKYGYQQDRHDLNEVYKSKTSLDHSELANASCIVSKRDFVDRENTNLCFHTLSVDKSCNEEQNSQLTDTASHAFFVGAHPDPVKDERGQEMCTVSSRNLEKTPNANCHPLRERSAQVALMQEDPREQLFTSSDEEDIYGHGLPYSSSETSVAEMAGIVAAQDPARASQEEAFFFRSDQLAESWMGYSGPGYGILSLVVSEKYIWCLDYKGTLYCSSLPSAGLRWQKFEDTVQQVAVSPSGALLWKIEQKSNKAFACGKVTIKGKRHWYEALPQTAYVALSDDTAWIIRTNGDLYLQTGLSVDRPCARAVKVDCPYPLSQITARTNMVWAMTKQRGLLYREGASSFCPEGEQWKSDLISERQALEPVCITLGNQQTLWALDISGNLWFRTGVTSKKPQGEDEHWWQVSITDYVVFDQCSIFQTIIQATQTVATVAQVPVEKVADKLRMTLRSQEAQCQPSLLGVNSSGVWITSGKNELHVAKGTLIGTFWNNVVPHGTASAAKWAVVLASAAPTTEGSFLWLCQSSKDLFCVGDQNPQFRPSTVQLPPDTEVVHFAACQDAVWALDGLGRIFIRTLSKSCPTGMHWTRLDLSQLGAIKLSSLTCGNQHVWACDTSGIVYFRVGTQPLNPSMMLPAWITIESPIQPVGVNLINIYSSPNDRMLWAIDSRWNVYVRVAVTEEMPVGTDWEHVPGLQACQLALSIRTVWARCPNGDIARRYGITDKNSAGDYWKKIPGSVICLTVTPMDELWAISCSGHLLQRLTKSFSHLQGSQKKSNGSPSIHTSEFEDEWEVI
ncbi:tectonin beta-propeller repeat-containing protein 2 isoform X2 [Microcaecilia unicolor]|uniref:Tectonin beta-propeller repeat-containing protein 2 isoform X2 n=1 Tax=Microcaecilia unicolor TaxID=1415580 RepID=A0A6P7Z2R9_9AMPH|nr:tectonin beta-propeller repeat-containing protein 2 isoform X2 [Microcaecilia unicolor]